MIGSSGSGKSTLARRIATRTGLPLIHLDALYWSADWQQPERARWRELVDKLLAQPAWVMDGNHGDTLPARLAACDAVVLLDMARWRCLWRIVVRRIRFHGRTRPDMGPGCHERPSWALVRFVWSYPRSRRPGVMRLLQDAASRGVQVIVLRTPAEVEAFMRKDLPAASESSVHQDINPQQTPCG